MPCDREFLASRPSRVLQWRDSKDGRVIVLKPRFGSSRWGRKIASFLREPDYRIRLDSIGSLVWRSCDGKTAMERVAQQLRKEFGDEIEPAEERLYRFVVQMTRSRMISFDGDPAVGPSTDQAEE